MKPGSHKPIINGWHFALLVMLLFGAVVSASAALAAVSGTNLGRFRQSTNKQPAAQQPLLSPTATCIPSWGVVASPNVGSDSNYLNSVAAISANDAWAVGYFISGTQQTLAIHWNGTQWNTVASPNVGALGSVLQSVTATSSNDVWAVGYYYIAGNVQQTLAMHWNGTQWIIVSSPNVGSSNNVLSAVSAHAANDVWAAGYYRGPTADQTLTMHWNNTAWSVVSSPNPSTTEGCILVGLAIVSTSDVWAVGNVSGSTLSLHWDGTQWSQVPTPRVGMSNWQFHGVAALSTNDVWAVGGYVDLDKIGRTLTEHWDGTQWSVVSSPPVGSNSSYLNGVTATTANEMWAVGNLCIDPNCTGLQTLILHWSGSTWSVVPSPSPGSSTSSLDAVAASPASDLWTVGSYTSGSTHTLVERNSGACSTPTFTSTATATPTYFPTPGCIPGWEVVPSIGALGGELLGVTALSADDVWAVGDINGRSLTLHWNGGYWARVPSPNVYADSLKQVSAISANDVWAVGYTENFTGTFRTVTEHWDGTQWNIVPSPNIGTINNTLNGVVAISTNDVWAVGNVETQKLILHWDGTQWSIVSSPNPPNASTTFLFSVAGSAANDVWTVGFYFDSTLQSIKTLTLHWNGSTWIIVPSPNVEPDPGNSTLHGVYELSANDVWAVGNSGGNIRATLTMHWDGTQWSIVPSPNPGGASTLNAVLAMAADDVWAVGYYTTAQQTLTMHWDGSQWSQVSSPNPAAQDSLWGVAGISRREVWAVGMAGGHTVAERYSGACATGTPTPPVTATPTSCPMSFTDVSQSDYFYQPVLYLYCRGVISGYSDNTFRPYNNTTRGQLAKIVVLARGWTIYTPASPTFRDVPTTDPFYQYIETAYSHNIISGYACGSGCLEFRPGNNVTRGQLSKIVVLAEGWPVYTPATPTFSDVGADNAFYGHIETAYHHNIISGYSCGMGCLEFRPGNNATRGQIAKIVYLAVTQP
jgi:hypothetical protein